MDKQRQSNTETVLKFTAFAEMVLVNLPSSIYKNKYFDATNTKDLPMTQKIGVYAFLKLLKWDLLQPFVKVYYRL